MMPDTKPETQLSVAQVTAWFAERWENCLRLATFKTGEDRAGWLEDSCYFRDAMGHLSAALAAKEAAEREIETLHMQAAACMTATFQNTRESVEGRIERDHPYWTQAYADVCAAVDREIDHRERAEAAEREPAALRADAYLMREFVTTIAGPAFTREQLHREANLMLANYAAHGRWFSKAEPGAQGG